MAVHQIAREYGINPLVILDTWTMKDLCDSFESIALSNHYAEQNIERN